VGVADHHVCDATAAVDQYPGLPADLATDFAEAPGELVGDQSIRRNVPAEKALELPNLTGLEPVSVPVDLDERLLGARWRASNLPNSLASARWPSRSVGGILPAGLAAIA
jgi:hypothetical protein